MKKWVYYFAFCLIVYSVGSIITDLIFADEIAPWKLEAKLSHICFGIVSMCYCKLSKWADETQAYFFVTILAIDNVCDDECSRKIREEAGRLNVLLHVNPAKVLEAVDKKGKKK